ncbi:glycosyl transferase family 2 [Solidesulfovibrio fructosivorans JJ]]|uniref:Glycosyl transferase family 2 n=1 Tax=Solidesulfovibrio fructosivorans JJ] TaxID=596151 RepID=E1JWU3_SOLFR|nr:glycosyltransferase family 2 protein [Solidesulfovibrio fructosivorans]EFL51147.1 glycosyl transferase family 2 [Solidesulfovibrio fructosivorans JJ]]
MNKKRYGLSVISYTYEDHGLAADLVASIDSWDFRPREIIVVDDGSSEPFSPPASDPALRVLRLTPNQGPGQAKIAGLSAASGRFLLSVDADIRLPPDWVTRALPLASRPEVGLVSAPILTEAGDGLLAAYQKLRFSHMVGFVGEPDVIPAGLWLLRRETWQRHGFAEYRERLHEDVYFSHKLRGKGLTLRILPDAPVRQVRRLSRLTMTRRGWTWQGGQYLDAASRNLIDAVNAFLFAMRRRMRAHHQADPRFIFYDYLYCAYGFVALLRQAAFPEPVVRALAARLAADLPNEALRQIFAADLADLGCPPQPAGPHPLIAAIRQGLCSILPEGSDAAMLQALPHLIEEDSRHDWHFSFYDASV